MSRVKSTFKRKQAVALRYADTDRAPRVVATGAGELAKRILELAKEHGVPVRQDDTLVEILAKIEVGHEIPPETYRAVAEILAFLFRTDIAWRRKKEAQSLFFRTKSKDTESPKR